MTPDGVPTLYHVQITPQKPESSIRRRETEFNITFDNLERRFLAPYRKGQPIVIQGRTIAMDELLRIVIYSTNRHIENLNSLPSSMIIDVTNEYIDGPPGSELQSSVEPSRQNRPAADVRAVFVVHGRNSAARDALFDFLRAIDLRPIEWSEAVAETGKASPYIGDVLNAAFSRAQAVVVLLTPDDEARLRQHLQNDNELLHETHLTGQARPNVLFEAGMAMARDEDRTILVELGELRPFSDIGGRHVIRLDNTSVRRQALAKRLESAGCPVNLNGTDWHTVGDFDAAMTSPDQYPSESTNVVQHQPFEDIFEPISKDEAELLVAAATDGVGLIYRIQTMGGLIIQTNSQQFTEQGIIRSEARWEHALKQLQGQGLIEDVNGEDATFRITHEGFKVADAINGSE